MLSFMRKIHWTAGASFPASRESTSKFDYVRMHSSPWTKSGRRGFQQSSPRPTYRPTI